MSNEKRQSVTPNTSFEKNLKRLEDIVSKMETGQAKLDETLELYKEGLALLEICQNKLSDIEHQVELLDKKTLTAKTLNKTTPAPTQEF